MSEPIKTAVVSSGNKSKEQSGTRADTVSHIHGIKKSVQIPLDSKIKWPLSPMTAEGTLSIN